MATGTVKKRIALAAARSCEEDEMIMDPDEMTDEMLAKEHLESKSILRKGRRRSSVHDKSKYNTVRGSGCDLWDENDESKHEVKAHIRDSSVLLKDSKWEELTSKGVTSLLIEDDDSLLKTIPSKIANIQTLKSFTLMWSKVKQLPEHLLGMTNLRELCLQKCHLKDISKIHLMQGLISLELANSSLEHIPNEIGEMGKLVHLDLTGNLLKSIPASIGQLSILRTLKLCGNKIAELPSSLTRLNKLETLDASQNRIQHLPKSIGSLGNLVTLRLSYNKLRELPDSLQHLHCVKHLYLGNNYFTEVPDVLGKLQGLVTLNMVSNKIQSMETVLNTLTTLLLDKNLLTEIPDAIFECVKLEKLSMQNNKLDYISPQIRTCTSLRTLYFAGNNIHALPDELCYLHELRHLVMRENQICELPERFDSLQRLSMLDIENTKLDNTFSYALKNDGVTGVMEKVRLLREERDSSQGYNSDHGSSIFDEEDEPASEDDLDSHTTDVQQQPSISKPQNGNIIHDKPEEPSSLEARADRRRDIKTLVPDKWPKPLPSNWLESKDHHRKIANIAVSEEIEMTTKSGTSKITGESDHLKNNKRNQHGVVGTETKVEKPFHNTAVNKSPKNPTEPTVSKPSKEVGPGNGKKPKPALCPKPSITRGETSSTENTPMNIEISLEKEKPHTKPKPQMAPKPSKPN